MSEARNRFAYVSEELTRLKCWAAGPRRLNMPINPATGTGIGWTDPKAARDFDSAMAYLEGRPFCDLGILFHDPSIYALDLDSAVDVSSKQISDWARDLIESFDTYTEFSRSGSGIHIIGRLENYDPPPRGKAIFFDADQFGNHKPQAEVFREVAKWIRLTGNIVDGRGKLSNVDEAAKQFDLRFPVEIKKPPAPSKISKPAICNNDLLSLEPREFPDWFIQNHSMRDVLESFGWTFSTPHRATRPGGDSRRGSALISTDDAGIERLTVFSQSTRLEPTPSTHTVWAVLVCLKYGGDFKRALFEELDAAKAPLIEFDLSKFMQ